MSECARCKSTDVCVGMFHAFDDQLKLVAWLCPECFDAQEIEKKEEELERREWERKRGIWEKAK